MDVGSGAQFTAWEDIDIDGQFPLIWRRFYSTGLLDASAGMHGPGWVVNHVMLLIREGDRYRFHGHDGTEAVFDAGSADATGALFDLGQSMELRREHDRLVVYHWHDWETEVHKFLFEALGGGEWRLERIELPCGHGVRMRYDPAGRLVGVAQDIERRELVLAYGASGLLDSLHLRSPAAPDTFICDYRYDVRGRLVRVIDALGNSLTYEYDEHNRLILESDLASITYTMMYDAQGRCVETTRAHRYGYRRISYNDVARVSIVSDSLGQQTVYQLNASGQVISEALPNGLVKTSTFDEFGRVTAHLRSSGLDTHYGYDASGNLAEVAGPGGAVVRVSYDHNHLPTAIVDADGARWELVYANGALVEVTDPIGRKAGYVRDGDNVLSERLTPAGNRIRIDHDEYWTRKTYSDSYGLIRDVRYNAMLDVVAVYDAHGLRRTLERDQAGSVIAIVEADGSRATFAARPDGRLTEYVDRNGARTRCDYGPNDEYIHIVKPTGAQYLLELDTEDRLARIVNPLRETADFEYDAVGNRVRATFFDERCESSEFDLEGRCIRRIKADETRIQYTHAVTGGIATVVADGERLIENAYDICGQLMRSVTPNTRVEFKRDPLGNVISETQGGREVKYAFGRSGGVERCTWDGSRISGLRFAFDARTRPVALGSDATDAERLEYDATDLPIRRRFAGMVESFEYDARLRTVSQTVASDHGPTRIARTFGYDEEDNLVRESDSRRGSTDYVYGPTGLLLESRRSTGGQTRYGHDLCGNLLQANEERFTYASGNRLVGDGLGSYEFDPNGNRLAKISSAGDSTRYEWDALDQLSAVVLPDGKVVRYNYDGLGRRVRKEDGESTTNYLWAGDALLAAQTGADTVEYCISEFRPEMIWHNGSPRHVVRSYREAPCELFDGSGTLIWSGDQDDFGRLFQEFEPGAPASRLLGQQCDDETGLHYNRFRYYDPRQGRFISPDPIGLIGGLNSYLYGPNAINFSDPLGLFCNKTKRNSVYVLTKNGKIVYVGITERSAHTRMGEHKRGTVKIPKKDFDQMTVVATDLTRRQARNIEGSALLSIQKGDVIHADGTPMVLTNCTRNDDNYYHSYSDSSSGNGRQVQGTDTVLDHLNNNIATSPGP